MDKSNDNKNNESPSATKKLNVPVKRSKSEGRSRNWGQVSNEITIRSFLSNFGSRKKNGRETQKKESANNAKDKEEAGPSTKPDVNITQVDASLRNPATNEITSPPSEGRTFIDAHAEEYFMRHKQRGKAIIFNHEIFEKKKRRKGTIKDVEKLSETLSKLKFDVVVHTDLEYVDILDVLKTLSREDHSDNDCLAIFVLTHGNKKREIAAKDVEYPAEKLWNFFTADKCISLAGKPKLFFINACRGKNKDSGMRLFRGRTETDSSNDVKSYKIPNHADFLIAYSTAEGFYSYREFENGTWFIQCFCEVLLEYHTSKDLLKMLTITARKVAIDYRTKADEEKDCDMTQVPSVTSMLIRDIYFHD